MRIVRRIKGRNAAELKKYREKRRKKNRQARDSRKANR